MPDPDPSRRHMAVGAVLVGGASRRMGRAKAFLELDGTVLAERVGRALASAGCDPVVLVGRPPNASPADFDALAVRLDWGVVEDRWPGEGPLGAIVSVFDAIPDDVDVVIAACDLPDLDATTVGALWPTSADDADMVPDDADAVVARTDRIEPLLARWRPSARARARSVFSAGGRAVVDVLADLHVHEVDVPVARLRNVNTPGDLGR